jgi:DNA ligase 1
MKPMLAATITNVNSLKYPLIGSPKIDGIRCIIYNGEGLTRNLKSIPNYFVRNILKEYSSMLNRFDGELISGENFQGTTSAIMSFEGEPDFTYNIFDRIDDGYFSQRFLDVDKPDLWFIRIVPQFTIRNITDLKAYEDYFIWQGFEGIMLRRYDNLDRYKFGRSTLNEAYLMKLKRFTDDEATIVGFEERLHNNNTLEKDNLGYAKRSTKQDGMIPMNTLGALTVFHPIFGDFSIGSGFTDEQRQNIWNNRFEYLDLRVKFKYQKVGIKDKPRFPVFLGIRVD